MNIHDEIIMMLEAAKYIPVQVSESSNLYTDLRFDSLDFISFLVSVEDAYSIIFDLTEMTPCLQVEKLISLVEIKVRERVGYA